MLKLTDLTNIARGFLMGGADIIPGVSGGTVALILGIYERLISAISHFDLTLFDHVRNKRWKEAAAHNDFRFQVTLFTGIALGVISLAGLMHYLLEHQLQYTYSVFFGLILASSLLVGKLIEHWSFLTIFGLIAGCVFAFWLIGQLPQTPPSGAWYIFLCGVIAICAMILPGISGAFILVLMGKYSDLTGSLRSVIHGNITGEAITDIVGFGIGAFIGIVSFSKFLKWLLSHYHQITMSLLCGFMIGSLRKLWPFTQDMTPEIEKFKLKIFEPIWPDFSLSSTWISILLAMLATAFVFLLDWFTVKIAESNEEEKSQTEQPQES